MSAPAILDRLVFKTSRLGEFCSKRELINQTGHDSDDWPLVIAKELVDNGLDGCEEGGIAPVIEIEVSDAGIVISDHASVYDSFSASSSATTVPGSRLTRSRPSSTVTLAFQAARLTFRRRGARKAMR